MRLKLVLLTLISMGIAAIAAPEKPAADRLMPITVKALPDPIEPPASISAFDTKDFWQILGRQDEREIYVSPISEAEAIRIALARGEALTAARRIASEDPAPVEISRPTASADPSPTLAAAPWQVTGARVNLRAGPGTDYPVLGQAERGERFTPLSEVDTDWIEIQRGDGTQAWIYARFLAP